MFQLDSFRHLPYDRSGQQWVIHYILYPASRTLLNVAQPNASDVLTNCSAEAYRSRTFSIVGKGVCRQPTYPPATHRRVARAGKTGELFRKVRGRVGPPDVPRQKASKVLSHHAGSCRRVVGGHQWEGEPPGEPSA